MQAPSLIAQEPHSNLWLPKYRIPEGAELISEREDLIELIREKVSACSGSILIAIDGAPGSGKSSVTDDIAASLKEDHTGLIQHKMDKHLKTAPGSKEREHLHRSDYEFEDLYADDKMAAIFLNKLTYTEPGQKVGLAKEYSRAHRAHIQGEPITIPEGDPRIVLFEGTGAHQISKRVVADEILPIHIYVDLATALRAKIRRDISRKIPARAEFHKRDIEMATRLRCLPSLENSKAIFFDNTANLEAGLQHFNFNVHTSGQR